MDRNSTALKRLVNPLRDLKCLRCGREATYILQDFIWCKEHAAKQLSGTLEHLFELARRENTTTRASS
jgi:hypothetical protein